MTEQSTPGPSILERSARAGTWSYDLRTGEIAWSPGTLRVFGLPVDAKPELGQLLALYTEESQDEVRQAIDSALEHGTGSDLELQICRPDGTRCYVNAVIEVHQADGRTVALSGAIIDIDRRKSYELRVIESERRLRSIFMTSVHFMGLLAADGTLLEINESSAAFGGPAGETPIGLRLWDTWWWSHSGDAQAMVHEAIERAALGEFVRFEAEVRAGIGSLSTIDFSVKPVLDEDGEIRVLIAEARDISERKQLEKAIRRNEERFRQMFDHAPIGMALVDPNGRWKTVNRSLCEIVGYSRLELIAGLSIQKLVPRADLVPILSGTRRLRSGIEDRFRTESRLKHKRGHEVCVQLDVSVLRDEHGEPSQFVVQIQDVGPSRRFEDALFQEKELAQVTLAAIGEGVIRTDGEGRIGFCNGEAARLIGEPVHRLLGREFSTVVRLYAASTGARLACPVAQVLRTGNPSTLPPGTMLECAGRGRIPVRDSLNPIRGLDGRLLGTVLVFCEAPAAANARAAPESIPADAEGRPDWARLVRDAMAQNRVELFAQRIVALGSDAPPSYEVLVRVRDEESHLLAPAQFLAGARESGMAGQLDLHVVRRALDRVEHLERTAPGRFDYVTINLSDASLSEPTFTEQVIAELLRRSIRPGRVRFEIAETAAIANLEAAQIFVARVRDAGCKVMVDQFGAGGGDDPEYLSWLGADGIKIDRSRFAGLPGDDAGRARVASIGNLGRAMGLDVFAGGIEDQSTADLLGGLGVSHAQGHLYHVEEPLEAALG